MAKESMKAREVKRARLCARYAEKRKALKEAGDWEGLAKLPKNSSPVRLHNRCSITGRPKGYMREFGISRIQFREMASNGLIPAYANQAGRRRAPVGLPYILFIGYRAIYCRKQIFKTFIMTDPIADYLTRIRNAVTAGHKVVEIPASR